MALITCDECGHRISDKSIFCPNCGYPTHLNKALRENSNEESAPAKSALKQPSQKSEMSDKAVEKILSQSTPQYSEDSDLSKIADLDSKEKTVTDKEEAAIESIDTDASTQVQDALAEYEATLSKPLTPEHNKRNKLILYFAVLLVLLLAIGGCYYYAKSNHLQSVDEVECEPIEEVLEEEPATVLLPSDSTAIATDSISQQVTTEAQNAPSSPSVDTTAQPAQTVQASPAVRQL